MGFPPPPSLLTLRTLTDNWCRCRCKCRPKLNQAKPSQAFEYPGFRREANWKKRRRGHFTEIFGNRLLHVKGLRGERIDPPATGRNSVMQIIDRSTNSNSIRYDTNTVQYVEASFPPASLSLSVCLMPYSCPFAPLSLIRHFATASQN